MELSEIFRGVEFVRERSREIDSSLLPLRYFSLARILREHIEKPYIFSIYGPRYSGKTSTLLYLLKEALLSEDPQRKVFYADPSTKAYSIALENPHDLRQEFFSQVYSFSIVGFDDLLSESSEAVEAFLEAFIAENKGNKTVLILTGSDQPRIEEIAKKLKEIHDREFLSSPNSILLPRPFTSHLEISMRRISAYLPQPKTRRETKNDRKKRLYFWYRRRKSIAMKPYAYYLLESENRDIYEARREISDYMRSLYRNKEIIDKSFDDYRRYGSFPSVILSKEEERKEEANKLVEAFKEYISSLPSEEYEILFAFDKKD